MERKTTKQLEQIKREVREITAQMEMSEAAEFMHCLSDWSQGEYDNLIYDDEPADNFEE